MYNRACHRIGVVCPQQHALATRAGLDAFTGYLFRVRATNAAGAGRWSELARIATAPAPPSQPLRIVAAGAVDPVALSLKTLPQTL